MMIMGAGFFFGQITLSMHVRNIFRRIELNIDELNIEQLRVE